MPSADKQGSKSLCPGIPKISRSNSRGDGQIITYSPAYTLVPTYECFNRCSYCNFRAEPGTSGGLGLGQARQQLLPLRRQGVIEILLLSGEVAPNSVQRPAWFDRLVQLGELALELGFLPHTNAGILTFEEMQQLKQVNVSLGLMLEQVVDLPVHRHAPSKSPALRLQQLEWAGQLGIAFTTGLLLGIGETAADRLRSLEAIAKVHQRYGHIQEVILQPYRSGTQDSWQGSHISAAEFLHMIALARDTLPRSITLQIPPNLLSAEQLLASLELGVRDLGGIGPKDEVNPDYPHPRDRALQQLLQSQGWQLQPRLPVYPQFDPLLPARLQQRVQGWRSLLSPKI
jgi:7,8-didemethyl-8-hydroxy-5-deazariboflavin synthase